MKFEPYVIRNKNVERTQASIVTDMIRSDIIAGIFPPGSKLLLRVLSERYGIGNIPLREALSRLAMAGFVEAVDQRGFRVAAASKEELLDILKVMAFVEAQALEDSVAHGDLSWEGRVVAAYHQLTRIPMQSEEVPGTMNPQWEVLHDVFHSALLSACTSPWLLRLAALLRSHSARFRFLSVHALQVGARDIDGEHALLLDKILNRDALGARNAMVEHLNTTARLAASDLMVKPSTKRGKRCDSSAAVG